MANDGMGGLPEGPSNVEHGLSRPGEGPLDAVRNTDAMRGKAKVYTNTDLGSLIGRQNNNGLPAGGTP